MGRYDLTDFEWSVFEPLIPMDRRGPKPHANRQILNGMFYILRAGSPWRDMPEHYGSYTTVYIRFNRWRKAGIWHRFMDAIVKAHDGKVQMIDSSITACSTGGPSQSRCTFRARLHGDESKLAARLRTLEVRRRPRPESEVVRQRHRYRSCPRSRSRRRPRYRGSNSTVLIKRHNRCRAHALQ